MIRLALTALEYRFRPLAKRLRKPDVADLEEYMCHVDSLTHAKERAVLRVEAAQFFFSRLRNRCFECEQRIEGIVQIVIGGLRLIPLQEAPGACPIDDQSPHDERGHRGATRIGAVSVQR